MSFGLWVHRVTNSVRSHNALSDLVYLIGVCGRFALYDPVDDLVERFSVDRVDLAEIAPRWNIAPSQLVPVVSSGLRVLGSVDRSASAEAPLRSLGMMRWGLVPKWADDPAIGNRMINARSETVASKPAFRSAFKSRRCIIPASGFYEWASGDSADVDASGSVPYGAVRRGSRAKRRPFYFRSADGAALALAGLWEVWHGRSGEELCSFTILTTSANGVVGPVHDRMPVILARESWDLWLGPGVLGDRQAASLFLPAEEGMLRRNEVGVMVNSPRNDGPALVEPPSSSAVGD